MSLLPPPPSPTRPRPLGPRYSTLRVSSFGRSRFSYEPPFGTGVKLVTVMTPKLMAQSLLQPISATVVVTIALHMSYQYSMHVCPYYNCRHRRSQTSNGDANWLPCMYMSATNLRHNSSGQRSSRSSTSGHESTSGSILKKRSDCNARLDANSSCSSSTVVGSVLVSEACRSWSTT